MNLLVEKGWPAGLFEGEGSIGWTSGRGQRRYPLLQLVSTDRDVLEKFIEIVGRARVRGPYDQLGRGTKPVYRWATSGKYAQEIMVWMEPLLCSRRRARWQEVKDVR